MMCETILAAGEQVFFFLILAMDKIGFILESKVVLVLFDAYVTSH